VNLLILSDIHGNWPALEAVLRAEPDHDAVAFCGDVVDYGPFPVECLRWLAAHADHVVRGNHDNAVAFDKDCHCLESSRGASLATRPWHKTLLSEQDLEYLRHMPTLDYFEWGGRHFQMSHGTPFGNPFEYLPEEQWGRQVQGLDVDYVLLGHTHIQGSRVFGKMTVVNPGSVGLARDRAGEACYAVFDGERVLLKRVPYDVGRTVAALRRSPLPAAVVAGLTRVLTGRQPTEPVAGAGDHR
jgi:putative phosphoesterase